MKFNNQTERYLLSDGFKVYANRGIIGLSPDNSIHEGYDGGVYVKDGWNPDIRNKHLIEIAEHMIKRWQEALDEYKSQPELTDDLA